jgi:hypothetical protein
MMIKARTPPLMYIREPPLLVARGYPLNRSANIFLGRT